MKRSYSGFQAEENHNESQTVGERILQPVWKDHKKESDQETAIEKMAVGEKLRKGCKKTTD